jgi:hypothetical protein
MPQVRVSGSYYPAPNDYDGMHSFQSRSSDKFGGRMNDKVNAALKNFYTTNKLNPTITAIYVEMSDIKWEVKWEVLIEESKDGKAYVGLTSRGGAGGAAYVDGNSGAPGQYKTKVEGLKGELGDPKLEVKQVKDFVFIPTKKVGWKVRQIFGIYTNPKRYPPFQTSQNATGIVIDSTTNKPIQGVKIEKNIPQANIPDNTRVNPSFNPINIDPPKY